MRRTPASTKAWIAIAACAFAMVTLGASSCGAGSTGAASDISGKTIAIYSSVPHAGPGAAQGRALERGALLAIPPSGKVGKYRIDYSRLGNTLGARVELGQAAQNALVAKSRKDAVGFINDADTDTTRVSIPILNNEGIAQVGLSPYAGLTQSAPGVLPGEPAKYNPKTPKTFVRLPPSDQRQAPSVAAAAVQLGCHSLHVWSGTTRYSTGLAAAVTGAARTYKLRVEGQNSVPAGAGGRLAAGVKADCLAYPGQADLAALTAAGAAHPRLRLLVGDGTVCLGGLVPTSLSGRAYCVVPAFDQKTLGAPAASFFSSYRLKYGPVAPPPIAVYGYESMALLLDSVRRAEAGGGGSVSRASVTTALFGTQNRRSPLGTYSIGASGDSSLGPMGLYRVTAGKLTPVGTGPVRPPTGRP